MCHFGSERQVKGSEIHLICCLVIFGMIEDNSMENLCIAAILSRIYFIHTKFRINRDRNHDSTFT